MRRAKNGKANVALTGAPAADFQCGLNPPSFPRSPAQVRFTPNGSQLVVTVKGTNTIYVFAIDTNGIAGDHPTITQAPGQPYLPSLALRLTMWEIWLSPSFSAHLLASL